MVSSICSREPRWSQNFPTRTSEDRRSSWNAPCQEGRAFLFEQFQVYFTLQSTGVHNGFNPTRGPIDHFLPNVSSQLRSQQREKSLWEQVFKYFAWRAASMQVEMSSKLLWHKRRKAPHKAAACIDCAIKWLIWDCIWKELNNSNAENSTSVTYTPARCQYLELFENCLKAFPRMRDRNWQSTASIENTRN